MSSTRQSPHEVLIEARAPDGRRYRLARESDKVYRLALPSRGWEARFVLAGRTAALAALVVALPLAALMGAMWWTSTSSPGSAWFMREVAGAVSTLVVGVTAAVGFLVGLFARRRPHHFAVLFSTTTRINEKDTGRLVSIEHRNGESLIELVTERARAKVRLRSAKDASALASALRRMTQMDDLVTLDPPS